MSPARRFRSHCHVHVFSFFLCFFVFGRVCSEALRPAHNSVLHDEFSKLFGINDHHDSDRTRGHVQEPYASLKMHFTVHTESL